MSGRSPSSGHDEGMRLFPAVAVTFTRPYMTVMALLPGQHPRLSVLLSYRACGPQAGLLMKWENHTPHTFVAGGA